MTESVTTGKTVLYYTDECDECAHVGTVARTWREVGTQRQMVSVYPATGGPNVRVPRSQVSVVTRYRPTVTADEVNARMRGAE